MIGRYILSPGVRSDLDDIWKYTEHRWGLDQAELYIRLLRERIEAVAAQPTIGSPCDDVRAGYYKCRAGSHFLFTAGHAKASMSSGFCMNAWISSSTFNSLASSFASPLVQSRHYHIPPG